MYHISFKDVAGPIATIIAALAAVSVTAYFAWHQKTIAKEQVDIAREKLRHDLYERRYRVFDAARKLLCEIAVHGTASEDDLRAFVIGTSDAAFLFDDDLAKFLEEMRGRAQKLQSLIQAMESMPVGDQKTNTEKQRSEHFMWLWQQLDGLVTRFKPLLKISESIDFNHTGDLGTAGINWRRGALRLWVVASVVWCVAVFSEALQENENVSWFHHVSPPVHVKISNTETWDYPAEWGVQRIRDDLKKRLAAEDEKEREWADQVPASRKAECNAIAPTTPFVDQPANCVRLFYAKFKRIVPSGWESQIATAPACKNGASICEPWERDWGKDGPKPGSVVTEQGTIIPPKSVSAWGVIAAATPRAIAPPLIVLALGISLFWAFAGFRRASP